MSEVVVLSTDESMESLTSRAAHIVTIKKAQQKREIIKEVIFPIETHFLKRETTTYTESVDVYQVEKVLKSEKIKPGTIKVWIAPDYSECSYKKLHELDLSSSPIVHRYSPKSPVGKADARILFLTDAPAHPEYFVFIGEEGLESEKQIIEVINGKKSK